MSTPTPLSSEQQIEAIPKIDGYPRRVENTPCWVQKHDDKFVVLIPVPTSSKFRSEAWMEMCLKYVGQWLKNEPENLTEVLFIHSDETRSQLEAAQDRRELRAKKRGVEKL